jgi:hypothetical protein
MHQKDQNKGQSQAAGNNTSGGLVKGHRGPLSGIEATQLLRF